MRIYLISFYTVKVPQAAVVEQTEISFIPLPGPFPEKRGQVNSAPLCEQIGVLEAPVRMRYYYFLAVLEIGQG